MSANDPKRTFWLLHSQFLCVLDLRGHAPNCAGSRLRPQRYQGGSGQFYHGLVFAGCQRVFEECLRRVGAAATGTLVFAGAAGDLVQVFLEVRTLLPSDVDRVSTFKSLRASSAALPASIGHVLVLSYAVFCVFRCGWIVGD